MIRHKDHEDFLPVLFLVMFLYGEHTGAIKYKKVPYKKKFTLAK
jgi:hypothetical protein